MEKSEKVILPSYIYKLILGASHHEQDNLKKLACLGHPVVLYDQVGCGDSTFVEDPAKDAPWLLTVDYYI